MTPKTKKLTVVAHATTVENMNGIHQGWGTEGMISPEGYEEIRKTTEILKSTNLDYALSSPLRRCKSTCERILSVHPGIEMKLTNGLRAKRSGEYEGKPRDLVHDALITSNMPIYKFIPEGGESTEELQLRVMNFFYRVLPRASQKDILIVTHGGVITTLGLHIFDQTFERYDELKPAKSSITHLEFSEGTYRVIDWANKNHLK